MVERGPDKLVYSSEYGQPNNPAYVEMVDNFVKDVKKAVQQTSFAPLYITTDVDLITHPKTVNR